LQVITGDGETEKDNLIRYFGPNTELKFQMDPFAKREHIIKLKEKGKKVMMIGDGLNDAGAIKASNAGVSISDDIFGFLPSCDAIMEAEVFNKLSQILTFSRRMKRLVILGFIISFLYNIVGLAFAVQGVLSPVVAAILMPISSITVVSFAIFSTNLTAKKNKII
jgi:Cu+-exporting ATPase